jgi:hypothetical protein
VPRSSANALTEAEIASVPAGNLYDLIEKMRPNFLRARGQTSITLPGTEYPTVYLDGRPYGEISSLRSIVPLQVKLVRYYSSAEAAGKFGMGSGSGVIEVTSK